MQRNVSFISCYLLSTNAYLLLLSLTGFKYMVCCIPVRFGFLCLAVPKPLLSISSCQLIKMPTCAVSGCSEEGNNRFPTVEPLRQKWLDVLGTNLSDGAVCDRHFCDSDFVLIKGSEDDGVHRILQPTAVPILHLCSYHGSGMQVPMKEEEIGLYTYEDSFTSDPYPEQTGILLGIAEATADDLKPDPQLNQLAAATEPSPFSNPEGTAGLSCQNPGKSPHPSGSLNYSLRVDSDGNHLYKCCEAISSSANHQKSAVLTTQAAEISDECEQRVARLPESSSSRSHMFTHSGEKSYICEQCGARFAQSSGLKRHIRTHSGEKPYKCDQCGASFTRSRSLRDHMMTHHSGEKPYKCELCGAKFAVSTYLKNHMMTHSDEKPYKCEQCGAIFAVSRNLKNHMMTHSNEKPYICEQCGARFAVSRSLKYHMMTHSGEKPYKCEQCGARYTQSGHLNRHMMTHSGEKPYKCEQCGAGFTQSGTLKCHMLTHSGEKPYKCEQCGASFTRSGALKNHMMTHSDEKR